MISIGIDPGKKGAIAVVQGESLLMVQTLENTPITTLRGIFNGLVLRFPEARVYVEDVHASPQMGVTSAFTFGKGFGVLVAYTLSFFGQATLVRPQVWQGALGCLSAGDKGMLYTFAKGRFPAEHKQGAFQRDQADAVLIALYGAMISKHNQN